jgi:hypothetical protein
VQFLPVLSDAKLFEHLLYSLASHSTISLAIFQHFLAELFDFSLIAKDSGPKYWP